MLKRWILQVTGWACIFLHTHHYYIWWVVWQWYAETTGDTGAECIHLQVGHFYSYEETWAIKDTRDLTVIPHSHRKQQSPRTSRWLCLKNKFGSTCHKERAKENTFLKKRGKETFKKNHLRCKYSVLCMKCAKVHENIKNTNLGKHCDSYSIQAAGGDSETCFSDFSLSNLAD